MSEHFTAYGYKTKNAAIDALETMYASGSIDHTTRPQIKSYTAKNGKRRYGIVEYLPY